MQGREGSNVRSKVRRVSTRLLFKNPTGVTFFPEKSHLFVEPQFSRRRREAAPKVTQEILLALQAQGKRQRASAFRFRPGFQHPNPPTPGAPVAESQSAAPKIQSRGGSAAPKQSLPGGRHPYSGAVRRCTTRAARGWAGPL